MNIIKLKRIINSVPRNQEKNIMKDNESLFPVNS